MSKKFEPPVMLPKDSAVKTVAELEAGIENKDEVTKVQGVATSKVVTDIGDIYVKEINRFVKFISGELSYGDVEERNKDQLGFVKLFNNIVTADPIYMNKALNHFIGVINTNPDVFIDSEILAPFYKVEKKLTKEQINKYKMFLLFMISYSKNIRNKEQFLRGFDVKYFVNLWPNPYRTNLHNFIYD